MIFCLTPIKGFCCVRSLLRSIEISRAEDERDDDGGSADGNAGCGSPMAVRC
jgi:hypothetical protein